MAREPKQGDYNYYSSICDVCSGKGWHKNPVECTREYIVPCKCCGGHENGRMVKCKGTNIMRDYSNIAQKFSGYYGKDIRIKVGFCDNNGKVYETKTGTVSMTTGWKPSLMLMLRRDSHGSSYLLSDKDILL